LQFLRPVLAMDMIFSKQKREKFRSSIRIFFGGFSAHNNSATNSAMAWGSILDAVVSEVNGVVVNGFGVKCLQLLEQQPIRQFPEKKYTKLLMHSTIMPSTASCYTSTMFRVDANA